MDRQRRGLVTGTMVGVLAWALTASAGPLQDDLAARRARLMFNRDTYAGRRNEVSTEFDAFFAAVSANRAKLALPFGPRPAPSAPLTPAYEFAARARDRFLNVAFTDTWPMIADQRLIKTSYEQTVMEKSGVISSNAQRRD